MSDGSTEKSTVGKEYRNLDAFSAPPCVTTSFYGQQVDGKDTEMTVLDLAGAKSEIQRLCHENKQLRDIIISYQLEKAKAVTSLMAHRSRSPEIKNEEISERSTPTFNGSEVSQSLSPEEVGNTTGDTSSTTPVQPLKAEDSETGDIERTILRYQQADGLTAASLSFQTPIGESDQSFKNESQMDGDSSSESSTINIVEVNEELSSIQPNELVTKSTSDGCSSDTESDIQILEVKEDDEPSNTLTDKTAPRIASDGGSSDSGSDIKITEVIEEGEVSSFWPNDKNNQCLYEPSSIYNVPEDFDPDQEDCGLSDVETVTSDEALSAWGIEEPLELDQTKEPLASRGVQYESDDDEEGWEAINKNSHPAPVPQSICPQVIAPPGPPALQDYNPWSGNNHNRIAYQEENQDEDDTSTINGDTHLDNTAKIVGGDGDIPKITGIVSDRSDEEKYQDLIKQIEEEILVDDMEETRKKAEEEEINERRRGYRIAMSGNDTGFIKGAENLRSYQNPEHTTTLSPLAPVSLGDETTKKDKDTGHDKSQKDAFITPIDRKNNVTPNHPTQTHEIDSKDPWLLDKFQEICSTLPPGALSTPGNIIPGHYSTVGWINQKPKFGSSSSQPTLSAKLDTHTTKKLISESDRILLSFDPREDVIGILRPKVKGEKNVLDGIPNKVTPDLPKKTKVSKSPNKVEGPIRKIGEIEAQFKILRDKQLERNVAQREVDAASVVHPIAVNINSGSGLATLPKNTQNLSTNRLIQSTDPTLNTPMVTRQMKTPTPPPRTPKASHKLISPSNPRKNRNSKNNLSPLLKRIVPSIPGHQVLRVEESDLNHQKSLRFNDKPTQNTTTVSRSTQPIMVASKGSQGVALDQSKALVSILKPPVPIETTKMLSKNRTYNYEYIREVVIYNLPKDATYSSLLDEISGGLLEKVIIDWSTLEARVVFVEPEAARKFFRQIERSGLWVHTGISQIELAGNENLVRCSLRGFQWTHHSSEMTPTMIQSIWNHRASRCLLLNNFPTSITVAKLTEDILRILADISNEQMGIIEAAVINRNLKVSSTGFLGRVRFCAITLALKVSKELKNSSPEYTDVVVIYDADPCGGLMGKEPPSCWIRGKEIMKDKKGQKPPTKVPESQPKLASPILGIHPVIKEIQAGQASQKKEAEAQNRQNPHQNGPTNTHARSQQAGAPQAAKGPLVLEKTKRRRSRIHPPSALSESEFSQSSVPPPRIFGRNYDNWGTSKTAVEARPEGAHWNHLGQDVVREYNDTIFNTINKRVRRNSNASTAAEKLKVEKADSSFIDRLIYLTNLPRNFHVARLLRFIRGGMIEHVELKPPTSKYNTSSAIIVFVHRDSVKTYKSYLDSPGLTIERNHRVVYAENIAPELVKSIRLLNSHSIRSDGFTRCLRVDLLPKDTMLGEFLGIIEEGMNHSNLEFEHASIDISKEDKDTAVAILRLMTIGTAVFVINVLRKNYDDINITFDIDPCQGTVEELDEVNLEMKH